MKRLPSSSSSASVAVRKAVIEQKRGENGDKVTKGEEKGEG